MLNVLLSTNELSRLSSELEHQSAEEIIRLAAQMIPNITFACSFGSEDMVILDLIMKVNPSLPIFYLDTDVLFPETYDLRDEVIKLYNPNLIQVRSELTLKQQAQQYEESLWERSPDVCCSIRKVQPLENHLRGYDGWITGIRRQQSPTRANAQLFEQDHRFGLIKVNPIVFWSEDDVWQYIKDHNVPYNVLHDQGYPSIGCLHCTKAVKPGEDPRSGRWAGFAKTECGLHQEIG